MRLVHLAVAGVLVGALGLAGCGHKAGLDQPPPDAGFADPVVSTPVDQGPGHDAEGRPVRPPGQKKSLFIDWLID